MKLANEEQLKSIWEEVDKWQKTSPSISIFHDATRIARAAVAEYISNTKHNATIYEFAAKKDAD